MSVKTDASGKRTVHLSFYLFGDQASAVVARDEPLWQAWMNETFTPTAVKEAS